MQNILEGKRGQLFHAVARQFAERRVGLQEVEIMVDDAEPGGALLEKIAPKLFGLFDRFSNSTASTKHHSDMVFISKSGLWKGIVFVGLPDSGLK
ncbi:MAG TPA: hypothetical protein PLK99_09040 [Burkholderiales bacterium]|nr:hypothetical protein [Burkholderiales bacterium]